MACATLMRRFTEEVYTFANKGAPLHIGKAKGKAIADPAFKSTPWLLTYCK